MSDRPYRVGRATLNRESQALAAQASELAVALAERDPRAPELGLLTSRARATAIGIAASRWQRRLDSAPVTVRGRIGWLASGRWAAWMVWKLRAGAWRRRLACQ